MRTVALLALAIPTQALGFCGTYVGQAGAELFNDVSQVILVREGNRTTLTLSSDYQGNLAKFALVIPVPADIRERDIDIVDPDVVQRIDDYTGPRLVEYACDDFLFDRMMMADSTAGGASCGSGEPGLPGDASGVTVEAEFQRGEYDLVLLSATESAGLFDWFDANGYHVDGEKADVLQETIDAGSRFLAAKVDLSRAPNNAKFLSPLRLAYDASYVLLPLRIGATASAGSQDVIVYALTDMQEGALTIDNYPEVVVEDECLWRPRGQRFGRFYADQFADAIDDAGGTGWTLEYQWFAGKCDPCAADPLKRRDVRDFGYAGPMEDLVVSRMHLRLQAEDVDQDLYFVRRPADRQEQMRYVRHKRVLEDMFPVCGEGWADNPGSCWDERAYVVAAAKPAAAGGLPAAGALLLGLIAFRRRRS